MTSGWSHDVCDGGDDDDDDDDDDDVTCGMQLSVLSAF